MIFQKDNFEFSLEAHYNDRRNIQKTSKFHQNQKRISFEKTRLAKITEKTNSLLKFRTELKSNRKQMNSKISADFDDSQSEQNQLVGQRNSLSSVRYSLIGKENENTGSTEEFYDLEDDPEKCFDFKFNLNPSEKKQHAFPSQTSLHNMAQLENFIFF